MSSSVALAAFGARATDQQGIAQPSFAEIQGTGRARALREDAFSVSSGRPDGNTLAKLIVTKGKEEWPL